MQPLLRVGRLDAQVWPLIGASIENVHHMIIGRRSTIALVITIQLVVLL